jgi:hypothetical protein
MAWKGCEICQKPFRVTPSRAAEVRFCSSKCRASHKAALNARQREAAVAALEAGTLRELTYEHAKHLVDSASAPAVVIPTQLELTPEVASRLRGQIAAYLPAQIDAANEVISGLRTWTPVQAKVFSTLLNKAVPDLTASFHKHEHTTRELHDYSISDLERLVSSLQSTINSEEPEDVP